MSAVSHRLDLGQLSVGLNEGETQHLHNRSIRVLGFVPQPNLQPTNLELCKQLHRISVLQCPDDQKDDAT